MAADPVAAFAIALRREREAAGMSMMRLGLAAGLSMLEEQIS